MQTKLLLKTSKDFINTYAPFCTHALTLQTKLYTLNAKEKKMDMMIERAQRSARQFYRRLAVAAYGNGAIRKRDLYSPLMITALEGTLNTSERNRTLHFHIALGNILTPTSRIKTEEQLLATIRDAWLATDEGIDDIKIEPMVSDGWITYISKECDRGNAECIDWQNCIIPHATVLL